MLLTECFFPRSFCSGCILVYYVSSVCLCNNIIFISNFKWKFQLYYMMHTIWNSSKITEIGDSLIAAGPTSSLSKTSSRKQIFMHLRSKALTEVGGGGVVKDHQYTPSCSLPQPPPSWNFRSFFCGLQIWLPKITSPLSELTNFVDTSDLAASNPPPPNWAF